MDETKIIELNGRENIHAVLDALLPAPSHGEGDNDMTRNPPQATADMFPGILTDIINACCEHTEAVPVAVAANVLVRFAALIGAGAYIDLGDDQRRMNQFVLMIGKTGLGKGSSGYGPKRLFYRVEDYMQLDQMQRFERGDISVNKYAPLAVHTGGLSSGEGLAAALHDGDENCPPVTDKRLLIFEPEFANVMTMFQRTGNNLSVVLRNAYDGVNIKPMTKRDKVGVTDPYICLFANITDRELRSMDQRDLMANNGMLNRFLILWQQPLKEEALPKRMKQELVDDLARRLCERVMFARRYSHETHYKKVRENAWEITLTEEAERLWRKHYSPLINRADGELVKSITRRHRLHVLLLSAQLALLDMRNTIEVCDVRCALLWVEYSRHSVIYSYNAWQSQKEAVDTNDLAKKILYAVILLNSKQEHTTRTDLHNFYQRKLKSEHISLALECLLDWIPPLIKQDKVLMPSGRTVPVYTATIDDPPPAQR